MRNPCKDCADRRPATKDTPSCHADCERYAAWKSEHEAGRAELRKYYNGDAIAVVVEAIKQSKRIQHKHRRR